MGFNISGPLQVTKEFSEIPSSSSDGMELRLGDEYRKQVLEDETL